MIARLIKNSLLAVVVLGAALLVLAAAGSIPTFGIVIESDTWRYALAATGFIAFIVGLVALTTKTFRREVLVTDLKLPDSLMEVLSKTYLARRADLSPSQRDVLGYIENELNTRDSVTQVELEKKFHQLSGSVYWRMEELRYLGFVEKRKLDGHGTNTKHFYFLTDLYQDALGRSGIQKPPNRVPGSS